MSDEIERLRQGAAARAFVPPPERVSPPMPDAEASAGASALADAAANAEADQVPRLAILGAIALAGLACVPHLAAATLAVVIALVGVPLSWTFARISRGRRQRAFFAILVTLLLVLGVAVAATLLWVRLGLVVWPVLPTG